MKTPEAFIREYFNGTTVMNFLGQEVDVTEAVGIPPEVPLRESLERAPALRAAWGAILAKCRHVADKASDDLKHHRGSAFHQYYQTLEERERAEWEAFTYDEDDVKRDEFGRKKVAQARIARGPTARWRRNFDVGLVTHLVDCDTQTEALDKSKRLARRDVEIAYGITEAIEHRMRCLSHLCALHRDDTSR